MRSSGTLTTAPLEGQNINVFANTVFYVLDAEDHVHGNDMLTTYPASVLLSRVNSPAAFCSLAPSAENL